jgi:hypothetical protein
MFVKGVSAQDGGALTMKFWLPRNGEAGGD